MWGLEMWLELEHIRLELASTSLNKAMLRGVLLAFLVFGIGAVRNRDDVSTQTLEGEWFHASQHVPELVSYIQGWQGAPCFSCIELFSSSWKVAKTWQKNGHRAYAYDIQNSASEDMLSRSGFYKALDLILMRFSMKSVQCSCFFG